MICPNCGSKVKQIVISADGRRLFACIGNKTAMPVPTATSAPAKSRMVECRTIVDEEGKPFGGSVDYISGGKKRTFTAVPQKQVQGGVK